MFLAKPNPSKFTSISGGEKPPEEWWAARAELFKSIADDTVTAPDTWEARLSRCEGDAMKRAVWEELLSTPGRLGALALIRNLRNMRQVGVDHVLVEKALDQTRATDVWPWQVLAAAREAGSPDYLGPLSSLMTRCAGNLSMIPGRTGVLVDVSGSMDQVMSERGTMTRIDAAAGLAVVLREACETGATATFSDRLVGIPEPSRGIALALDIVQSQLHQGTYLGQAVAGFVKREPEFDRLIVVTDEQAQQRVDYPKIPSFIINVAPYQRGVEWDGEVTRINGWSGGVLRYIARVSNVPLIAAPTEEEELD